MKQSELLSLLNDYTEDPGKRKFEQDTGVEYVEIIREFGTWGEFVRKSDLKETEAEEEEKESIFDY